MVRWLGGWVVLGKALASHSRESSGAAWTGRVRLRGEKGLCLPRLRLRVGCRFGPLPEGTSGQSAQAASQTAGCILTVGAHIGPAYLGEHPGHRLLLGIVKVRQCSGRDGEETGPVMAARLGPRLPSRALCSR